MKIEVTGQVYLLHIPWIKEGCVMPFLPENHTEGGPKVKATLHVEYDESALNEAELVNWTEYTIPIN